MNKKLILLICSAAVVALLLYSCQRTAGATGEKSIKAVEAMTLSPSKYDVKLSYQGIVAASETRNYFFTTGGKVSKVYVKEGQYIKKGDLLAALDTEQLDLTSASKRSNLAISQNSLEKTISTYDTNIANAEAGIETLKQSINVAQSSLDILKSTLEANEALYKAGSIAQKTIETQRAQYSKSEADFAALLSQLETARANLEKLKRDKTNDINTARENVNLSRISMNQAGQNIADATLKADSDGYITKIAVAEGDYAAPNSSVVTVKSSSSMVSIGVSSEDYGKLSAVKRILINNSIEGKLDTISIYPDKASSTYAVDITFTSDKILMGDIVDVDLVVDSLEGVFVPMNSVININGVNYVYRLNADNTVSRVKIDIMEIHDDKMLVSNLSNETIVTTGLKALNDNDAVSIGQNGGTDD